MEQNLNGAAESQGAQDTQVDGANTQESGQQAVDPSEERFSSLNSTVSELAELVRSQQAQLAQFTKVLTPQPKQYTQEELAQNPALLVRHELNQFKQEARIETQKQYWDEKAKTEFPVNDPKFKKALEAEWADLNESGFNNPKSLYKACENAALKLGVKNKTATQATQTTSTQTVETSTQGGNRAMFNKPKYDMNHNSVKMYQMMYPNDKKGAEALAKQIAESASKRR